MVDSDDVDDDSAEDGGNGGKLDEVDGSQRCLELERKITGFQEGSDESIETLQNAEMQMPLATYETMNDSDTEYCYAGGQKDMQRGYLTF